MNGQQVLAQRLPVAMETFDEPLYVNAKQYHRIIKRRQARAKLEAEGKIPKQRKVMDFVLKFEMDKCFLCTLSSNLRNIFVDFNLYSLGNSVFFVHRL